MSKVNWSNNQFPKWISNDSILNVAAECWNCHPDFQSSLIVGGHYDEHKPFSPKICQGGIHLEEDTGYVICESPEAKVDNPSELLINTHDPNLNDGPIESTKNNIKTVTFHPHIADAPTLVKHYFSQHTSPQGDNDGLCHNKKDEIDILNEDEKHPHPYHYCSQFPLHQGDKSKHVILCSKKKFTGKYNEKDIGSVKDAIENHKMKGVCQSKAAKQKCQKLLHNIKDDITLIECPSCRAIDQFKGDNQDKQFHRELLYTGDGKLKCMIVDNHGLKTPWPTFKKNMIDHYHKLLENSDTHDLAADYIKNFDSLQYLKKKNLTTVTHSLPKQVDSSS